MAFPVAGVRTFENCATESRTVIGIIGSADNGVNQNGEARSMPFQNAVDRVNNPSAPFQRRTKKVDQSNATTPWRVTGFVTRSRSLRHILRDYVANRGQLLHWYVAVAVFQFFFRKQ